MCVIIRIHDEILLEHDCNDCTQCLNKISVFMVPRGYVCRMIFLVDYRVQLELDSLERSKEESNESFIFKRSC